MRFSLRLKIMGLFLTTFIILIGMFIILSTKQNRVAEEERNIALRQADTIALQGSIERHQRTLEKVAVNLLNTDELITFFVDQGDTDAKMVLEGMFLSFQEEGVVRFILYSKDGRRLVEQSKNLPHRSTLLPDSLQSTFEKAAEDFNFHYYFRGVEESSQPFPAEYCLVTVITDDDDNTIGFAELALDAKKWLSGVAELTGNAATLWDAKTKSYTLTTDDNLIDKIVGKDITIGGKKSFLLTQIESTWLLTDIIPLKGPNNEIVSSLLLSRDVTISTKKGQQSLIYTLLLSIGIVVFAIGFTTFLINRGIITPINKVISFASDLATGHLADSLEINTRDEVADMGKSLNLMAEQIRRRASEAEAISTGDLTIPIVVKSSNDVLGTSLKHIVSNLGEIIGLVGKDAELLEESSGQVSKNAEEIRRSSETIKNSSISIFDASEDITRDVEKLASATEQMSASVCEISENTSRSKLISTKATELSDQAAETISSLDSSAEKIEKASGAISDFADQTNLLALNATIEAARAGDAGKGFAVVASEVKDLATQSISTAKSISQDIDEIKNFTGLVVKQTKNVSKSITELDESALVVSAALAEQSTVADDLAHTISGTYEQVKTFAVNISDISDSITQNNEAIISLSASSQEMSDLSKRLQQAVGRFTLV
ncbi:MAG: methyl-accepting chemotaxis protein [Desulfobulbaceae bacterium]|nr:methyl-accepting chemotaxis protein [Desulfobulbaceae bacterium]